MSMVEAVKDALRDEVGGLVDDECLDIMARAAIEAMREPTPEMVEAGWRASGNDHDGRPLWKCTVDVQVQVRFVAMIDAALAEAGEGR